MDTLQTPKDEAAGKGLLGALDLDRVTQSNRDQRWHSYRTDSGEGLPGSDGEDLPGSNLDGKDNSPDEGR